MKTEAQPAAPGHTFNNVKEIEANMKARMDKALTDLQHDMAAIRTGRASVSLLDQHPRRLLRHAHAAQPGGNLHVPEPALITDSALGCFADRRRSRRPSAPPISA